MTIKISGEQYMLRFWKLPSILECYYLSVLNCLQFHNNIKFCGISLHYLEGRKKKKQWSSNYLDLRRRNDFPDGDSGRKNWTCLLTTLCFYFYCKGTYSGLFAVLFIRAGEELSFVHSVIVQLFPIMGELV